MSSEAEKKETVPGVEESLERLAVIVERLESEETKLHDALELYREGHNLAKSCRKQLTDAELIVTALTDGSGEE